MNAGERISPNHVEPRTLDINPQGDDQNPVDSKNGSGAPQLSHNSPGAEMPSIDKPSDAARGLVPPPPGFAHQKHYPLGVADEIIRHAVKLGIFEGTIVSCGQKVIYVRGPQDTVAAYADFADNLAQQHAPKENSVTVHDAEPARPTLEAAVRLPDTVFYPKSIGSHALDAFAALLRPW